MATFVSSRHVDSAEFRPIPCDCTPFRSDFLVCVRTPRDFESIRETISDYAKFDQLAGKYVCREDCLVAGRAVRLAGR